jgi:hypothetical protein
MTAYELTVEEIRLLERRRQRAAHGPAWAAWIVWSLLCLALLIGSAAVYSVYGPGIQAMLASRFQTAQDAPPAPIPTQTAPRPVAPAVAPPVAPQPVYVAQPPDAAPPVVVAPAPPATDAAPALAAPQVVYIQSTGGSTVATGAGTNRADGGASTGVCALGKGARRCGR